MTNSPDKSAHKIAIIPLEFLSQNLTKNEMSVLIALWSFKGKDSNRVFPSRETIAKLVGFKDVTTVSKVVTRLSKKGYVKTKKRGFSGCNSYFLFIPNNSLVEKPTTNGKNPPKPTVEPNSGQFVHNSESDHLNSGESDHDQLWPVCPPTKNIPENIPVEHTTREADLLFGKFWDCYPKKKSKGSARKAWDKIKPDEKLSGSIIQKVNELRATWDWKKKNGQFIPYPATWLNAEGWLDEAESSTESAASEALKTIRGDKIIEGELL